MITDPYFYLAAIPAILLVGISKGGLGAMAVFGVPILALVISPVQAAGILLPILLLMDAVAIRAFWKQIDKTLLMDVLPAGVVGVGIGWATATFVNDDMLRILLGGISVGFVLIYVMRKANRPPRPRNRIFAAISGTAAGYTSFVAHSGAPPYQIYSLPLKMESRLYAGTTVYFFAIINIVKLIPYYALGQFDTSNLTASAILAPIALVSTLFGVWLVKVINQTLFYRIMYAGLLLVGCKLIYDGIAGLL